MDFRWTSKSINAAIRNLRCLYCTCERNFHGAFMVWAGGCVHHKCDMNKWWNYCEFWTAIIDDQIHDRVLHVILYTLIFFCDTELYACILLLESLKIYRYHFLYPVIFVSRVIFKKYIDVYKCIKVSLILCEILKAYSLQTVKSN